MNTKQTNKLASYNAIEALLNATPEVTANAAIAAKLAILSARIGDIHAIAATQTQPTEGETVHRDELLASLAEAAVEIATAVALLADEEQLTTLAETVNVSANSFAHTRRSHRPWLAQRIHDAAQSVLPQLAAYGVAAETLAGLQARIDAAQVGMNQPRMTIVAKKTATEQLAGLFANVDALLEKQIDRLIFPYRKTNPQIHAAYQSARSIVDRRGARRDSARETPASPAPEKQAA